MTPNDAVPKYFPGLDGIRAVSVLIVFLAHAGFGRVVPGGFGVTVFFFLSGFLITSLLIREHETYGRIAIAAFYQRRIVRLMPPLLVTMGLAILAVYLGFAQGDLDPWKIISQLFFFSNYYAQIVGSTTSVNGFNILWSLSVEEQFYLIFPFFFIALANSRFHIPAIIVVILLTLVWRFVRFEVFLHSHFDIYVSTDTRIDSILFGCLLALLSDRKPDFLRFILQWRYLVLALSLAALVISFIVRDPQFRATLRYTLQGIALLPIFYLAVNQPNSWLFSWLNWRPVRRLGQYSYTFYLAHFVIIKIMIFNGLDIYSNVALVPLAFGLAVIYSDLVYRLIEKPLQPVRSRLQGHS